jgi:acetylornithine deacetylase/succinyl-diaminopimelate desuccinylase-like protein
MTHGPLRPWPLMSATPPQSTACRDASLAQPLVRVHRNGYSVDPAFAGRRVELRVSHIAKQNQTERVAAGRDVEIETQVLSRADPTRFDPDVTATLSDTVAALGEEPFLMPSGAGHDAQCIAALAPAGMLFVPSVGGVSHSPLERTADEHVVLGARALAGAWTAAAG